MRSDERMDGASRRPKMAVVEKGGGEEQRGVYM